MIQDFCRTVRERLSSIVMYTSEKSQSILQAGKTTTQEALQLYDSLEPVNCDFMWGRWRGAGPGHRSPNGWTIGTIQLVWERICRS